jgi:hypothetical protein
MHHSPQTRSGACQTFVWIGPDYGLRRRENSNVSGGMSYAAEFGLMEVSMLQVEDVIWG